MTRTEIYEEYLAWEKSPVICSEQELFRSVIGNQDVYEGPHILINYLHYQVCEFHYTDVRSFLFCEANMFFKDGAGNLELIYSVLFPPCQMTTNQQFA